MARVPIGLLDNKVVGAHTRAMGQPNRISIPDARGSGASLRVTRHSQQRKVVLSHWRDGVCVASTPIELVEIPTLIGVLVEALGDAATASGSQPPNPRVPLWTKVRNLLRPSLAGVVELPLIRGTQQGRTAEG